MGESVISSYRRWNKENDERLLALYYQEPRLRVKDIADQFGTTSGAIQARLHRLKAVRRHEYRYFKTDEIEYIKANIRRKTYKEIARDLGRDPNSLRAIAYRNRLRRNSEEDTHTFLAFVGKHLEDGCTWDQITRAVNEHFDTARSEPAVRQRWWYHRKKKDQSGEGK